MYGVSKAWSFGFDNRMCALLAAKTTSETGFWAFACGVFLLRSRAAETIHEVNFNDYAGRLRITTPEKQYVSCFIGRY